MFAKVFFTPLYGASDTEPQCYLLQIEDCRILLNCGWNEAMSLPLIEALTQIAPTVDAVLVTHPDLYHLGALPYAVGKLGLTAPIFCTLPVCKMGQMFLYDAFIAKKAIVDFDLFSPDDIDHTFENMEKNTLKYSQRAKLPGPGEGIVITPCMAGHMLGGTFWRIQKDSDEIVFAVDYNHRQERLLNPSILLYPVPRPRVMISNCNTMSVKQSRKNESEKFLFDTITNCLRGGGNVLIPTDTAGRSLQLLLLLDNFLRSKERSGYKLCFCTHQASNTIQFARSMLEWMSDAINKEADAAQPFALNEVKMCDKRQDLLDVQGPKVILASSISLEWGFAKEVFLDIARSEKNCIILTRRCVADPDSLGAQLHRLAQQIPQQPSYLVRTMIYEKVPLEGPELQQYQDNLKQEKDLEEQQRREAEQKTAMAEEIRVLASVHASKADISDKDLNDYIALASNATSRTARLSADGLAMKSRMFPFLKKRKTSFSLYGWAVSEEEERMFAAHAVLDPAPAQLQHQTTTPAPNRNHDPQQDTSNSVPMKFTWRETVVDVKCRLHHVDFDGLADGGTVKTVLAKINPHKLVIVQGSPEDCSTMQLYAQTHITEDVVVPAKGQCIDVSPDANIVSVRLTDSLLNTLKWHEAKQYTVAYLNARVQSRDMAQGELPVLRPILDSDASAVNIMNNASATGEASVNGVVATTKTTAAKRDSCCIGDIKLRDIRVQLQKQGIQAYFTGGGGVLVCNGQVIIKKVGPQIVLEGAVTPLYFTVRDVLTSQLRVL